MVRLLVGIKETQICLGLFQDEFAIIVYNEQYLHSWNSLSVKQRARILS